MHVIDTDPAVLRQSADLAHHAYEQSIIHIEAEIKGVIPELMETLTPEGPFGYTIMPEVHPDGSVRLPIITTREGHQRRLHDDSRVERVAQCVAPYRNPRVVVHVSGQHLPWSLEGELVSKVRPTKRWRCSHQVSARGITGELVWVRVPRSRLGGDSTASGDDVEEMFLREQVFLLHKRYLDALRAEDLGGVLETLHDGAASALRTTWTRPAR